MEKEQDPASVHRKITDAASYVASLLPDSLKSPSIGIICGSGLGGLADVLDSKESVSVDYKSIPYFPESTVKGHAGKLVVGHLAGKVVVLMVGRLHFYEGHTIQNVALPVRVFKLLGVHTLFATNAAGGLNDDYKVGDIVIIRDHLNLPGLSGIHPLRGPNVDAFGPRFPPLSDAYDLALRRRAHRAWSSMYPEADPLQEGIYSFVSGPSFETRAESRFLRMIGSDLAGMSTVPEVIVARHCGIRVLALSLVTNKVVTYAGPSGTSKEITGLGDEELRKMDAAGKADHQEVLDEGRKAAQNFEQLIKTIVKDLDA